MIEIKSEGLKEIIRELERIATPKEIEETDKKAFKRCGQLAHDEVAKLMPRSKNVAKSGRKGSRTYQHAADNIPVKIKNIGGKLGVVIGWDKSANDPYFYVKFIEFEFGSSKKQPVAPFKKTFIKQRSKWDKIFEEEYNKLFERLNK